MTDTAELIARLRDEAGLKRDCNVCDGDGIKESGRPCGGCNQTGSVLVYSGRVGEMMSVTLHDGHGGLPRVATFRSLKDNANG